MERPVLAARIGANGGVFRREGVDMTIDPSQREDVRRIEESGGRTAESMVISAPTRAYTGKTCRVVRNRFTEEWERSGLTALPMPRWNL